MRIQDIQKIWPLGCIRAITPLRGGAINKTFKVTSTDGAFVLRVYMQKKAREVQFEIALLKHISGLPVPHSISFCGRDMLTIGSRPAIVYRHIPGARKKRFTKDERAAVGSFLAVFHKKGSGFLWHGKRNELYSFNAAKKKNMEHAVSGELSGALYERFLMVKEEIHLYSPPKNLSRGPIHVDVKPDNILFSGGTLSGVIDFDNAYIGPFLLDLAKSMVWFGIEKTGFSMQKARDVYLGYAHKRKLTVLEYKELYRMVRFAFASHLYVDFYMKAAGKIPAAYFNFLMNDFYNSYLSFSRMSEQRFYELLDKKND